MEKEQQIQELEERIRLLYSRLNGFHDELRSLQSQLNELKGLPAQATTSITSSANKETVDTGLDNYIGLRFMHILGIIVLVIGLSIGVKYAIDRELISEAMRIVLAYAAGGALFVLSWRLRRDYQRFSAILFSGSMASLYFTTYAAFVYYQFFPSYIAFAIMIALTIYTVISAISYNREEIAVLGMVGAYGIPFLVSNNSERVDLFFSYILLINIGVVFISFRRTWRWMQYLALVITWILFDGWAFMRFDDSVRVMGTVFMMSFFLLFLVSALGRSLGGARVMSAVQVQQVIINNIAVYIASILLYGYMGIDVPTGLMTLLLSCLALGATLLFPGELVLQRLLAWQAIALLVIFISARWEGLTVTLLWIGVSVMLFVWGVMNRKAWPRLAAILLIGVTLGKLIIFDSASFTTIQKIISFLVIGVLLLLFSFYYQKFNRAERLPRHE